MSDDHLARAKEYIARGEDYYRRAAEEIVAAMDEDPALSFREVDRRLGRGHDYARKLVQAHSGGVAATPFARPPAARTTSEVQRAIREDPKAIAEAIVAAPEEARAEVRQALYDAEVKANAANPEMQRAKRKLHQRDFEDDARRRVRKAFDALSSRIHFFGDVVLNDIEKWQLEGIVQMGEHLLRGVDMDDDLRRLLQENEAGDLR